MRRGETIWEVIAAGLMLWVTAMALPVAVPGVLFLALSILLDRLMGGGDS